ncbi:G-protein coupled receptor 98 [Araneus ventricosus]|uniref:G-protein coupled receptor 98 n=1 Tax=Araneus ventricosus TaxID=182803 RepID=A0A4Y2IFK1_ARAVE|nr:G-protein coupled receptor 98 [Araneus ventricosus]
MVGPTGCGMFEEFRRCGPPCPPTCDTLKEMICCEVACIAGCFCADGYILEKDPTTGPRKCIPLNQCPSPGVLSFERPTFSVLEGSGKAIITVVRVNGSYSPISCRYRVMDSAGPYFGLVGELEFPDGVVSRTIEIPLQDNAVRDPDLTVRLELFEPSRKTGIVDGTFILTILDDDMTPGYLELEKTQFSVPENVGSVRVQVLRHEGSDGQLRVKYRTVPDSASSNVDFSPTTGELIFEEGETSKTVTVSIVDDEVRETSEKFKIELFDFTHGPGVLNFRRRGSVLTADVTIIDNDMRPGILQLERPSYTVYENAGIVDVSVVRVDGQDGQIKVKFETRPKSAKAGHDFETQMGELVFEEGELRKTIRIKIVDDNVREPEESFEVILFDATPGPGTINFRGLETTRRTTTITITDDDMNPGVLKLDRSTYEVMEDVGSVRVDVVRTGGQDGRITVQYQTKGLTANEKQDFVPTSGSLIFEEGEMRKSIVVQIKDDVEKEPLETLEVQLLNPTPGPGIVHFRGFGQIETTIIKIRDNDMTPGILQFERPSYEVLESVGTLKIGVVRLQGSDGEIRVKYRTVASKAVVNQDFVYIEGELVFNERDTRKDITVQIIDDDVREPIKAFQVQLIDAGHGPEVINFKGLGPITTTVVTITDDDMRPGSFMFERPSYEVPETVGTVKIGVVRVDGSDGQIRVKYRTVPKSARVSQDFLPTEGELVFEEGQTRKDIVIQIVDDDIREPTKGFEVQLLDPTPGLGVINFRRFTSNPTAVVSIIDDDMRPGTFQLEKPSYDIYENVGTITIGVIRLDGTDGEMRVKYKTIPKTAQVHQDFVPVEGELVFGEKETRKDIVIKIVDDDVREATKTFEVQLLDITPGVGVINFRRFTSNPTAIVSIRDDDSKEFSVLSLVSCP